MDEARRAAAGGVERVGVVGGDGTIHVVLDALSGTSTALAIVPVGTGNDLATALRIPPRVEDALERARSAPVRRIDLGEVAGRPFAGTGGVGFDGEVARRVRDGRIRRLGSLAYAVAAVAALRSFDPPRVTVDHDGGRIEDRVLFAVLANSPRFGGGMIIAPDAALDDGRFDLVVVKRIGLFELVRALPRVYSGRHVGHPRIEIVRTRRALLAVDRPVTVWGDGEPIVDVAAGAVEFRIRPGALAVVA